MTTRDAWRGAIAGRRPESADVRLVAPLRESASGGSGAFLSLADDGRHYWIKPLNNHQGPRVPITEQIVGRVGELIGAPSCEVRTVAIPPEAAGWQFRADRALEDGIAHGSVEVEDAVETRSLEYRSHDDNRHRHCAFSALFDWCWGGDAQWLRVPSDDHRYYSHDHGWYLPPEGPTWSSADLEQFADVPREFESVNEGFDLVTPVVVAERLDNVTHSQLADALASIPWIWPVSDEELEAVGYFLARRAPQVATRLRQRFGGST